MEVGASQDSNGSELKPAPASARPQAGASGEILMLARQKSRGRGERRESRMYLVDGQLCWSDEPQASLSSSGGGKRNSSMGLLFGSSMDLSGLGHSFDSSGGGAGSDEAISYRIKWCRENIAQLKRQTWPMEKKLQVLKASKLFIKQHQGELKQSKQARNVLANTNALLDRYWRHFRRELANFLVIITPWEMRIKKIESHFGSVVASYFTFLRWIFWLNLANSLVLVAFVLVPELIENVPDPTGMRKGELGMEQRLGSDGKPVPRPEFNPTLSETWEFEGFLKFSPIFYGYYSNREISRMGFWRNPLAFLLSALLTYIFCFICISRKLSQNTKLSRIGTKDDEYTFCWTVFVGWDFMIGNSETAYNKTSSLVMNLKEGILEEKEQTKDRNWRLIMRRVLANLLTVMLLVASACVVTLAVQRSENLPEDASLLQKNELQLVMSGIQFMFPPLFDVIGIIEKYHPRKALSWQLGRILFLDFLNFYTLMFSLFGTVDQMGNQLGEVAGNITLLRANKTYWNNLFTTTTTTTTTTTVLPPTTTFTNMSAIQQQQSNNSTFSEIIFTNTTMEPSEKNLTSSEVAQANNSSGLGATSGARLNTTSSPAPNEAGSSTASAKAATIMEKSEPPDANKSQNRFAPPTTTTTRTEPDKETTTLVADGGRGGENEAVFETSQGSKFPRGEQEEEVSSPPPLAASPASSAASNEPSTFVSTSSEASEAPVVVSSTKLGSKQPAGKVEEEEEEDYPDLAGAVSSSNTRLVRSLRAIDGRAIDLDTSGAWAALRERRPPGATLYTPATVNDPYRGGVGGGGYHLEGGFRPAQSGGDGGEEEEDASSEPEEEPLEGRLVVGRARASTSSRPPTTRSRVEATQGSWQQLFHVTTGAPLSLPATTSGGQAASTVRWPETSIGGGEQAEARAQVEAPPGPTLGGFPDQLDEVRRVGGGGGGGGLAAGGSLSLPTSGADVASGPFSSFSPTEIISEQHSLKASGANSGSLVVSHPASNCLGAASGNSGMNESAISDALAGSNTSSSNMVNEQNNNKSTAQQLQQQPPHKDCLEIPDLKTEEILALNETLRDKLKSLCWETMFGQEMVKIVVMDLVMTVISAVSFEFMRACFVRYCNRFFFWDLERGFPGYQDFKIAENVLHLVNNQSSVWMGMFFAPGLPAINTVKLAMLMYVRSWAVLTCNIPHETVFKVSKSNNFYYWILLINLLICILPVAYAITWIRPSWHCGPFGGECRMYLVVTKLVKQLLPPEANTVFSYLSSAGAVIPILIALILIIYYLASTLSSSKEANKELKAQLKKDKEQEAAVPEITTAVAANQQQQPQPQTAGATLSCPEVGPNATVLDSLAIASPMPQLPLNNPTTQHQQQQTNNNNTTKPLKPSSLLAPPSLS